MLDQYAERLEKLLMQVVRLGAGHADASDAHLPMAEGVLLVELLHTGEVTQQQMADRLGLDKSRVSRLCAALERRELLSRQRDETNRRSFRVRLTRSGTATAERLRQVWHERHQRLLAAMAPDERRALLVGLGALVRELKVLHADLEHHHDAHDHDPVTDASGHP